MLRLAALAAGFGAVASSVIVSSPQVLDAEILRTVNAANAGWTAGVNTKFEGKTLDEVRSLMGAKRDPKRRAALRLSTIEPLAAPPATFNSTQAWPQCASVIGHIRDQSDCG